MWLALAETFYLICALSSLALLLWGLREMYLGWVDKRQMKARRIANSRIYTVGRDCFKFTKGVHH